MWRTFCERLINGHKRRGKSRKAYLEETTRQAGCNQYADMKRSAINREEWRIRFATTGMAFSIEEKDIEILYTFQTYF